MEMNMNDFKFEVVFDSSEGWVVRLGDVKNIIDHMGNINSKLNVIVICGRTVIELYIES